MNSTFPDTCLVSSCLMGFCTRYDGCSKPSPTCITDLAETTWYPICPEQFGGLATPRERANLTGGDGHDVLAGRAKVLTESGRDVTEQFLRGARLVLELAKRKGIRTAVLKAKSPSCAIYGTTGVTAALLMQRGFTLLEY